LLPLTLLACRRGCGQQRVGIASPTAGQRHAANAQRWACVRGERRHGSDAASTRGRQLHGGWHGNVGSATTAAAAAQSPSHAAARHGRNDSRTRGATAPTAAEVVGLHVCADRARA